jgi:hypothetical protein
MDEHNFESIERQLIALPVAPAPEKLRQVVLAVAHRRLRAQRWDRLLARAAAAVFVVGLGLNAAVGISGKGGGASQTASAVKIEAVTQAALAVADATDPDTATQFAKRMAMLGGVPLSADKEAAIQRRIKARTSSGAKPRTDG